MALYRKSDEDADLRLGPLVTDGEPRAVPKHRLATGPLDARAAYQIVHDELMLDGNARLNLATFVTTWMEPEARVLMEECAEKNMIDKDEYPQTAELERRCVNILSALWNSPSGDDAVGCSTTGSSEAAMLAGLALKRRWRGRVGDPAARANLVMGVNVQVCWDKFCNYFEVDARQVPMEGERFNLDPQAAVALCDENTIGIVAILGSTFDGSYERVNDLAAALDDLQEREGLDIPIHVDAASGGFTAPFLDPQLVWDFRLPRVASINASGHKYGLVFPGVGWALWRDRAALPEELVFHVNYLGGDMPTFALNFSRPAAQVALQYYAFLRLGHEGFRRVQQECRNVATQLAARVARMGPFELLTDGSELPVFAFKLRDEVSSYSVFDVSARLRERGWTVPAYTFPKNREDLAVLRVVVRNSFSMDLADLFAADLERLLPELEKQPSALRDAAGTGFHH